MQGHGDSDEKYFNFLQAFSYLKENHKITTQKMLAENLGIAPNSVSEMKLKGKFPANWLDDINIHDLQVDDFRQKVKIFDQRDISPSPGYRSKDFLFGTCTSIDFSRFTEEINIPYDLFNCRVAVDKEYFQTRIGKVFQPGDVFVFLDIFGNVSPDVKAQDVLLVNNCNGYSRDGLYLMRDGFKFKVKRVASSEVSGKISAADNEKTMEMTVDEFSDLVLGYVLMRLTSVD